MIPNTVHGLAAMKCVSAMQKAIRRSMEVEAMQFAVELVHTSLEPSPAWSAGELEIISHEDVDTISQPHVVPFVATAGRTGYAALRPQRASGPQARLMVGSAIRAMCRPRRSRRSWRATSAAAIGSARGCLEGLRACGPRLGISTSTRWQGPRAAAVAWSTSMSEGATLIPPPTEPDPFEQEAVRLWTLKAALEKQQKRADLFDAE